MRPIVVRILPVLLILGIPSLVRGQEPPTCSGRGATAPSWYTEPPGPPAGVYQAAARSGGCEDAQTAQKVAARLASWLLLHERSRQALVEQTLRRRRQSEAGGRRTLSQTARVVERSTLRKVLERSRVHRQATRWTENGKAEHFLVLRADTAALKQAIPEQRTRLETSKPVKTDDLRPSEADLSWVRLPASGAAWGRREGSPQGSRGSAVPLRRVVLSWETKPSVPRDTVPFFERPQRTAVGVMLTSSDSPRLVAVGAEFRREPPLNLTLDAAGGGLRLRDSRLLGAYGLLALPGQAVPVYAGYRHRSYEVVPTDSESEIVKREERAVVLGLGVPPFTELELTGIRNAYLEAAVWTKFLSLAGGGRVTLVQVPGGRLNGLLEVGLALRHLGEDALLGNESVPRDGEVYLDQARIQTGLELELGGTLGVFGTWQAREATPKILLDRDGGSYGILVRSVRKIGPASTDHRFRLGLRLSC